MKIKLLIALVIIGNQLYADEQPTWSIVHLAELTDTVVEAKIININDEHYTMLIKDLKKESFSDTIVIKVSESYYETESIRTSDLLIIYTSLFSKGIRRDTLTGGTFRLLKDGKILTPWQIENPGKVSFGGSTKDTLSWNAFKGRILAVNKRIKNVYKYNDISDRSIKNKLLLKFLEDNIEAFNKRCGVNEDCGWGFLEEKVFRWITQSGIAEDTWKSTELYRSIYYEKQKGYRESPGLIYDEGGSSFRSKEDEDFLISIASSKSTSLIEKKQALFFLKTAKPRLDNIKDKILPLLNDLELRQLAIEVINEPRSEGEKISKTIRQTLKTEYNNAIPGEYKNEIGKYLGRTCTKEEWKEISGSDENLAFYLYSIRVDTSSNVLSFRMYYDSNKKNRDAIYEMQPFPKLIIENSYNSDVVYEYIFREERLKSWSVGFRVPLENLNKGEYHFYVEGKAGKDAEYKWKSIKGKFKIE